MLALSHSHHHKAPPAPLADVLKAIQLVCMSATVVLCMHIIHVSFNLRSVSMYVYVCARACTYVCISACACVLRNMDLLALFLKTPAVCIPVLPQLVPLN